MVPSYIPRSKNIFIPGEPPPRMLYPDPSTPGGVYVRGYYRKDGTYVAAHYRRR